MSSPGRRLIRSRRLVQKEVVKVGSNCKISSGDLGIPLVVIRLRVTGLKKSRVAYLLDLFEGKGEKKQCD